MYNIFTYKYIGRQTSITQKRNRLVLYKKDLASSTPQNLDKQTINQTHSQNYNASFQHPFLSERISPYHNLVSFPTLNRWFSLLHTVNAADNFGVIKTLFHPVIP